MTSLPPTRRAFHAALSLGLLCLLAFAQSGASFAQHQPPLGDLPWAKSRTQATPTNSGGVTSARQLLVNIDDSLLDRFRDGQPMDEGEEDALRKILYRISGFPLDHVERLQRRDISWSQLADDPQASHLEIFHLLGRVKRVEPRALPRDVAEVLEYHGYYRVEFQLDGNPQTALVCARQIPQAWKLNENIDHRASLFGLFLKVSQTDGQPPQFVFAANRVAWLPDRVDPDDGVTADLKLLAELGMDVGLLDEARRQNRKGLGGADRECFYQMLAAVGGADPQRLSQAASAKIDLAAMLTGPSSLQGRLYILEGSIRRVTRIDVTARDINHRFGIDHYWQLDGFVPLGDIPIRLGEKKADGESPVFNNNFPITICVPEIPVELQQAAQSNPDKLNQRVRLPAYFFKVWSYKSQFISGYDSQQRQPSPMFIGADVQLVELSQASNPYTGLIAGLVFVALLGGVWIGLWRYGRGDKKFRQTTLGRRFEPPEGKSLNDLDLP